MKISPGTPYPIGATFDGAGTNFSVFSSVAERVELCLFDENGRETRVDLPEVDAYCWHGYMLGVTAGQRYGYRVHGPGDQAAGNRCNPAKLLLDPYAKAIDGTVKWNRALFGFDPTGRRASRADSARFVPRSVVVNPYFDWSGDQPPRTPLHDTVIYEAHVKGLTKLHQATPPEVRGTYSALALPPIIDYLKTLGVTAIELMPVHQFVHEQELVERGLSNYWGYNSIGFFAPHNEYASTGTRGEQVQEFKRMVKALHAAGIEVILDVVYNHTAEGNHLGPVLSMKGFDNAAYYRLGPEDARYYVDYTGCGNSLNMRNPHVLQLIMDSLRYWIQEMHVDGFRFDLAAALARELHDVDRLAAFFDLIQQDPVIRKVKLIAEPWDVGEGGYQVGNFPPLWSEWNGKYRDTVRDYWRGENQKLGEFAYRLTGSSDLYEWSGRRPSASVNFVTAHDGFTLADLVSYNEKHNEANGHDNSDGENHNRSWNHGVEGPTDDPEVLALRRRQQRNFVATLLFSQGVPMLLHGDEFGRTQQGNNNGYCQDNESSWVDWSFAEQNRDLLDFVRRMLQIRREQPVLRRRRWFQGRPIHGAGVSDLAWFRPDGEGMSEDDWAQGFAKAITVFLNGEQVAAPDARGEAVVGDSLLLLLNAAEHPLDFTIPAAEFGDRWRVFVDTADPTITHDTGTDHKPGDVVGVDSRSLRILTRRFHS
jgi:glycogen operon protein